MTPTTILRAAQLLTDRDGIRAKLVCLEAELRALGVEIDEPDSMTPGPEVPAVLSGAENGAGVDPEEDAGQLTAEQEHARANPLTLETLQRAFIGRLGVSEAQRRAEADHAEMERITKASEASARRERR